MFKPDNVPPVSSQEIVARFILASSHIRKSNNTVKPDAFIPFAHVELSVTRHRESSDAELWREGVRVASIRNTTLHGRADVDVVVFTDEGLSVVAKPIIPDNPNHADVVNWPAEKPAQKMKAIEIAQKSQFHQAPNNGLG